MELLIGIGVVVVVVLITSISLLRRRGTGGTTVIVDNIAIGLTGGELRAVLRGMTSQERTVFYQATQGDAAAGEAFVSAVRRWLRANPEKAAQKGYPLP